MSVKKLTVGKQILIANYKLAVNESSGIEAGYKLTPSTDGVPGLNIYGYIRPNVNRVYLGGRDVLTPRGITETAAQAKYMVDTAALKTFFGLSAVGDDASAAGMPWIKLDGGGVYWDTAVAPFPESTVFSTTATDGVKTDNSDTHKYLNYFNPATGDYDATPVKATASDAVVAEGFYQKNKITIWVISGILVVGAAVVAIFNPFKWGKKTAKKK